VLPPDIHRLEADLAADWPPDAWQDVTVLLAVSGGADSVALLRAMSALKTGGEGRLCAAHLNHRLRDEQSQADEAFVVELCRRLEIACEVGRAEVRLSASQDREGLEEAARKARYQFLEKTAARLGARYVVTAHTADDQAETILHRILRGTGIGGLCGMPRIRLLGPAVTLIRPMLGLRRAKLLAYLDDLGQPYRSDASNDDIRYTRNRIRHRLLPHLARHFNTGVVDALLRLAALAAEVQNVVELLVDEVSQQCVSVQGPDKVQLDLAALSSQPRYVVRELLMAVWRKQSWPMQAMGFAEWDLLGEMAAGQQNTGSVRVTPGGSSTQSVSKRMFPGNVLAEVRGGSIRLMRVDQ